MAAPPNKAAAPTAAVLAGAARSASGAPVTLMVGPPPAEVWVGITAEVKGTPPVVVVAPLKAGCGVVAAGLGEAVVLFGFSTLYHKT